MKTVPCIFVFGASRGLGHAFVSELRGQGETVSVLIRDPAQAEQLSALGVQCLIGDALCAETVRHAIATLSPLSQVISTLGSFRAAHPVDFEGNRLIIDAMERASLSDFLLVTSFGCGETWPWLHPEFRSIIGPAIRLKSLAESWLMSSTLAYRILRPVGLTDGDATGKALLTQHQEVHGRVRRKDVAQHGLALLKDPETAGCVYSCHDPSLTSSGG